MSEPAPPNRFTWLIAPIAFAILTVAMFFDLLFQSTRVISGEEADLTLQFLAWREFGFDQLRSGHLPLWNPHVFGGAPYFAGFQSALLYPPNWLHLFLPLVVAINWIVALHVFAMGYFTYLWCRDNLQTVGGSILAGAMAMFAGPYFLHLQAGHLPHLAVMVWTPLIFLWIDRIARRDDWRGCWIGLIAIAMQILAGHPQYVYYVALAAGIYALAWMFHTRKWRAIAIGVVAMYFCAAMLSAIQLLPGIEAAGESVRAGGTRIEFASMLALSPQHLITFVAPNFLGMPHGSTYFGSGYLWELSCFASVCGLVLALLGICRLNAKTRTPLIVLLIASVVLALGWHTPLYQPLFDLLPGYSSFRGTSKFMHIAILCIARFAAVGFDGVAMQRRIRWPILLGIACVAIAVGLLGMFIAQPGNRNAWSNFVDANIATAKTGGDAFAQFDPHDPQFLSASAANAARSLYLAAISFGVVAILLWAARFHRWVPYALVLAVAVEGFIFARSARFTMIPIGQQTMPMAWESSIKNLDPAQRVFIRPTEFANAAMRWHIDNLGGYDPGVLKRFAELIFASQGVDPSQATQYFPITHVAPNVFRMLRCALVFVELNDPPTVLDSPMPVAKVMSHWIVADRSLDALRRVVQPDFNPTQTLILESPPPMEMSDASENSGVEAKSLDTDSWQIDAVLSKPAMLLITNNFASGWRIKSSDAIENQTHIVPANYAQIGIPLGAGEHHFILNYSPLSFRVGSWISLAAIIGVPISSILLKKPRRRFR